jgi:hypothetical protein
VAPGVLDGSLLSDAHPVLDLGEGLLDRIEIWRVRRQEPEPGAGRLDHLSDGDPLVGAEIVHDDDVARLENRNELLLDVGAEALAVDRAVEDARGSELIAAQRAEEGHGAPAAVWRKAPQPVALRSPSAQRGHAGLDPGLVEEDQAAGIEASLPGSPAPPPAGDVVAGLLTGEQCFF